MSDRDLDRSFQHLFQEIILEHYRRPKNRGELSGSPLAIEMKNPVCGDLVGLHVHLEDGKIGEIRFAGHGCSISQASASMMTEIVRDLDLESVAHRTDLFRSMLHSDADAASDPLLGHARALAGVARFPARVRCAMLPWNALQSLLDSATVPMDSAEGQPESVQGTSPVGGPRSARPRFVTGKEERSAGGFQPDNADVI